MPADHIDQLRLTAERFAKRHIAPGASAADHEGLGASREFFDHCSTAGFDLLLVEESFGGTGLSLTELSAIVSTLAEICAGHAMVIGTHATLLGALCNTLTSRDLSQSGVRDVGRKQRSASEPRLASPSPTRTELLPPCDRGPSSTRDREDDHPPSHSTTSSLVDRLLSGRVPLGVSLPMPRGASGFDSLATFVEDARRDACADGSVTYLTGPCGVATNVTEAGLVLVFGWADDDTPVAAVLEGHELLRRSSVEHALGLRALPMVDLDFSANPIVVSHVVAQGLSAFTLYTDLLGSLAVVSAAATVGLMRAAHERAIQYARERVQGGRRLIDHTHLQQVLGTMTAAVSASAVLVAQAASMSDLTARIAALASVSRSSFHVCSNAVQLFGGYGYTREVGVEKLRRDAAVLALVPVSTAQADLLLTCLERQRLGMEP